jgi:hypothetical protein
MNEAHIRRGNVSSLNEQLKADRRNTDGVVSIPQQLSLRLSLQVGRSICTPIQLL